MTVNILRRMIPAYGDGIRPLLVRILLAVTLVLGANHAAAAFRVGPTPGHLFWAAVNGLTVVLGAVLVFTAD